MLPFARGTPRQSAARRGSFQTKRRFYRPTWSRCDRSRQHVASARDVSLENAHGMQLNQQRPLPLRRLSPDLCRSQGWLGKTTRWQVSDNEQQIVLATALPHVRPSGGAGTSTQRTPPPPCRIRPLRHHTPERGLLRRRKKSVVARHAVRARLSIANGAGRAAERLHFERVVLPTASTSPVCCHHL